MCDDNMTKCECNQKELCTSMLKAAILETIEGLEENINFDIVCRRILEGLKNILEVYQTCIPCQNLLKRVSWVKTNIRGSYYSDNTTSSDRIKIKVLIAELKAFIGK